MCEKIFAQNENSGIGRVFAALTAVTMNHDDDLQVINGLLGKECERTLACNSIKLRFECDLNPKGKSYIWIDPPWELQTETDLVAESGDYHNEDFQVFSNKFKVLDKAVLSGVELTIDNQLQLEFEGGYYIYLPHCPNEPDEDSWYEHWYAKSS